MMQKYVQDVHNWHYKCSGFVSLHFVPLRSWIQHCSMSSVAVPSCWLLGIDFVCPVFFLLVHTFLCLRYWHVFACGMSEIVMRFCFQVDEMVNWLYNNLGDCV